jgi:hypothetical protein
MSVRVDLQSIPAGYFIDQRDALGVMTGQYTLLEYQTAGFSPKCEGFFLEQCSWIAKSGSSVDFVPRGSCSRAIRLKMAPECIQRKQNSQMQNAKGVIKKQAQNSKVLHLLPIFTHP